MLTARDRY